MAMYALSNRQPLVTRLIALVVTAAAIDGLALSATVDLDVGFAADQSLWQGSGGMGFDMSGQFGGTAGIRYEAVAESGTVAATSNGVLQVEYPEVLTPNSVAPIELRHMGDANDSSLASMFGASVEVEAFIPCVVPTPLGCLHPRSIALLDAGFLLDAQSTFTTDIGSPATASDVDNAIGIGPNIDLIIGELGATVNVDLAQSITLTPTAISGLLYYENRGTGEANTIPFTVDADSTADVTTAALSAGVWDFAILDTHLENQFRNNIDLDIRPTINYIVGEWPPPGSPLFSIGLLDTTFALDFDTYSMVDAFTITVIPEPATLVLVGLSVMLWLGQQCRRA